MSVRFNLQLFAKTCSGGQLMVQIWIGLILLKCIHCRGTKLLFTPDPFCKTLIKSKCNEQKFWLMQSWIWIQDCSTWVGAVTYVTLCHLHCWRKRTLPTQDYLSFLLHCDLPRNEPRTLGSRVYEACISIDRSLFLWTKIRHKNSCLSRVCNPCQRKKHLTSHATIIHR